MYFQYYGDLAKALKHYIQCGSWQKAHSIFIASVVHSLFLSGAVMFIPYSFVRILDFFLFLPILVNQVNGIKFRYYGCYYRISWCCH